MRHTLVPRVRRPFVSKIGRAPVSPAVALVEKLRRGSPRANAWGVRGKPARAGEPAGGGDPRICSGKAEGLASTGPRQDKPR